MLLIGTGRHQPRSGLRDIHSVRASLVDLRRELVARCGLADDAVTIAHDPPSSKAMLQAVVDAAEQAEGVLWVHFIGHGLVFDGKLYLATADSSANVLLGKASSVEYEWVARAVQDSQAGTRVITLDCCYSGLAIGMESDEQAVQRLTTVENTLVLTATAGSQEAIAPPDHPHTAFTGALIGFLKEGDDSAGRELTLGDAHRFLSAALPERYGMTPLLQDRGNGSVSLVLAANRAYRPPVSPPDDPDDSDGEGAPGGEAPECPYPGARPFRTSEQRWFFGRDAAVRALVDRLEQSAGTGAPVVLRHAPGAGASSLLRAGLFCELDREAPDASAPRWLPVLVECGPAGQPRYGDPLRALAVQLAALSPGTDADEVRTRILDDPEWVAEFLHRMRRERANGESPDGTRVVLIIDEYGTARRLDGQDEVRTAFVRALAAASAGSDGQPPAAVLLVTVRGGAPDPCGPGELPCPGAQGEFELLPLTGEGLREVIEGPARDVGVRVSPELISVLRRDLDVAEDVSAGDRLPLLARALRAAWKHKDGRTLTVDAYHRSGGLRAVVAALAEDAYGALDADEQDAARLLLLRMVHVEDVGEGAADSLRPVDLDDFTGRSGLAHRAAGLLVRGHAVVTTDSGSRLVHPEILHWRRLRAWIDADRAGLAAWQRLLRSAAEWEQAGRTGGWLTGGHVADAEQWKSTHRHLVTPRLEEFLDASSRRRTSELHRRVVVLVVAVALIAGLGMAAAGSALYAFGQRADAVGQRDIAQSRRLAAAADAQRGTDPRLAALLAVEAYSVAHTREAESSLLSTQAYFPARRITVPHPGLNGIVVAPDGRRFATANQDGTVGLGTLGPERGTTTLTARPHPAPVYAIAFSPDGRHLAAAHGDGGLDLWTTGASGGGPATLTATIRAGQDALNAVAFNADGRLLATGGDDGTLHLWRTADVLRAGRDAMPTALRQGHGPIEAVAFAPHDPDLLVVGNADTTATVVDLDTSGSGAGSAPRTKDMLCGTRPVNAVAVSGDGTVIATGDDDGTVRLWGPDGTPKAVLSTPATRVESVAFSKDGGTLAAAGDDGGIRLWDTVTGASRGVLSGPAPHVTGLAFVAGPRDAGTGTEILAGAGGDTVALWSVATGQPHAGPTAEAAVDTAVFGPPGSGLLATAGSDGAIRFWHLHDPMPFAVVHDPTPAPAAPATTPPLGPQLTARMAFSPDGSHLAFIGRSGAVVVWDVKARRRSGKPLIVPVGGQRPAGEATAVAYSPDGSMLVAADSDRGIDVWNARDPQDHPRRATVNNQLALINALAFRGDGVLAAAGNDGTIDLAVIPQAGSVQGVLNSTAPAAVGHLGPVEAIAFSRDNRTLASGGADLETRLWTTGRLSAQDTPVPQAISPALSGHTQAVVSVAFSPDGTLLANAGQDRTVMLWDFGAHSTLRAVITGLPAASTAAFDPDPGDPLLATADDEGRATFWSTRPSTVIRQICGSRADHPGFTAEQWSRFNPGQPRQDVCAPWESRTQPSALTPRPPGPGADPGAGRGPGAGPVPATGR